MRILSPLIIATLIGATWQTSATAALLTLDDPKFGVGAITRDTDTGLDWLDVPLTQGRAFVDVAAQFGIGGELEGFRHASVAEWRSLVINAGIPDINVIVTTANVTPFTTLFNLVGVTGFSGNNPRTLGFLNDFAFGLRVNGELSGGITSSSMLSYVAGTTASRSETFIFPTVGHWLVRPVSEVPRSVPEPYLVTGLAIFGFSRMVQKKLKVR